MIFAQQPQECRSRKIPRLWIVVEAAKLMSSGEIKQAPSNEELVFAMRNVNVSTIFFVALGQHFVSTARLHHAGPSSGLSQTSHKSKVILYPEQIRGSRQYFKSQSSKLSARSGRPDRRHKMQLAKKKFRLTAIVLLLLKIFFIR